MMPRLLTAAALSLAIALPAAPMAAQAPRAQAAADWTKTVTATPKGAFILGNPNAKTKIIEYMSYSCSHCADFGGAPTAELKAGWIRRGLVSIEYRNYVRDPFDLSAALLARCGGTARFLANHDLMLHSFDAWTAKAQDYKPANPNAERTALLLDIGEKVGLIALAGKNGVTPAAARACISDANAMSTVLALTSGAQEAVPNFEGTPTFILDGKPLAGVHSWAQLKPLLPPLPASGN
jgi:protein-disulfide isomerase